MAPGTGTTGSNHPCKVTGTDGVGGGSAESFTGVFTFNSVFGERKAAWAHGAVLTTDSLQSDGAGFHGNSPVKYGIDLQFLSATEHLLVRSSALR